MPINYFTIKKECALRSAQLEGTDAASLEMAYNNATFTSSLDGAEVPASSFKTVILNIEKELAHIIGSDASHPYRTFLYAESDPLANLASTPSLDSNGVEFVGVFDAVRDASNNIPCTFQPPQTLEDLNNTFFDTTELYNYSIRGNRIQHTRTEVIMEGWTDSAQQTPYFSQMYSQGIQILRMGSTGTPNIPLASQPAVTG